MVKLEQFLLEHQALMCMKGYRVNNGGVSLSLISFHFISHQFLSWDLKLMTMEELEWVVFMLLEWVLSYFQCIEVTLVKRLYWFQVHISTTHPLHTALRAQPPESGLLPSPYTWPLYPLLPLPTPLASGNHHTAVTLILRVELLYEPENWSWRVSQGMRTISGHSMKSFRLVLGLP